MTESVANLSLLAADADLPALKAAAAGLPSWDLTERQLCDLEMLLNGAFAPLTGYMNRADHSSVLRHTCLADGRLWPLPVVLDVSDAFAGKLQPGQSIALRDAEGVLLAVLDVAEQWPADREAEARALYGSVAPNHPGVEQLLQRTNPIYLGGRVRGVQLPTHYDFTPLRKTPAEVRREFARSGWSRVAAFLTRNPLHRLQYETTRRGARLADANLLVLPIVGPTQPGDVDYHTRLRGWEEGLRHYPEHHVQVAALPLAMRLAGPREAMLQAIVARNYGCSHVIVGPHQGGAVRDEAGRPFYAPGADPARDPCGRARHRRGGGARTDLLRGPRWLHRARRGPPGRARRRAHRPRGAAAHARRDGTA